MQLADLFDHSLVGRSGAVAIEHHLREGTVASLSFGDLDARSNRVARLLVRRGLKAGDRLCLYLANRIEFIDVFLACTKLGVIFVPMNILYREREIAHIVADAGPSAVVTTREAAPLFPRGTVVIDVSSVTDESAMESPERVRVRGLVLNCHKQFRL